MKILPFLQTRNRYLTSFLNRFLDLTLNIIVRIIIPTVIIDFPWIEYCVIRTLARYEIVSI